ncbi:Gfo/Idh/MocA family protein [Oceanimonas sp. MB9]|uniref:Gfo/Idh/MocA family protein n=1 Tax=Oceanimonas sp. MB9 TaxID=2588453 RepID=UPI0013F5FBE0|nr:Gfo/Idh/MocA family oxidoreductase [Oceanimonas sp. MB9]NHI00224.1 1,5-anhydro-D-fructose reductase [Oceanimonas sp. MB9]
MTQVQFGIIGSGMIAGVIARAIHQADGATLKAVASRRQEKAAAFAQEHHIPLVFTDWQQLVQSDDIDAVYVATPTAGREEICMAVLEAGKHLISEKPFLNQGSVTRIAALAKAKGLAFMDATHFSHHPRTAEVIRRQQSELGAVNRIRTSFFFPFMDRENIRFDPTKEPTGAVGDMAWYNLRAIVEYMQPNAEVHAINGLLRHDPQTGAVVGGAGLIAFTSGQSSSFDFGYDAGVCQMDLDIIGENGLIQLDDYVLDWKDGFAFDHPDQVASFRLRQGMASPTEFIQQRVTTDRPQAVHMIQNFCDLISQGQGEHRALAARRAIHTQTLLDQFCQATGLSV